MAVGCNWMQDCLKLVSLWPDTMFPLQAREFQWGSVSVNGSTNSSSPPCPAMGSWSKRCLIFTMGGEPSRPCSLTKIWKILTISQKTPCSQSPTAIVYPLPVHRGARHPAQDGERLYALVVGRKTSLPCGLSITHTQRGLLYKIPTAGAPTRSVGRNCGKWPVNGCGTYGSHWERRCKGARYARSNGHLSRLFLPFLCQRKARLKSMDPGSGQRHLDVPQGVSEPILSSCKKTERCAV